MSATGDAFIPVSAPRFGPEEEALVLEVIRSGQVAQGPKVARFEELCATMAGTRHAIAVSNGTVALEAALEVLGIGPGDEVVTTPFTFAATLNAVLRSGATVRCADIAEDFTLDPAAAAAAVGSRTAALLPVHLYGLPADMDALVELATRYRLAIVEDAAQAHGAEQRGRRVGSFGTGCFSFYATKNVTSAEGGIVTTSDDAVADRLRVLRNQGMRTRYEYVMVGQNLRMTDLAAALAIPQMERLDALNASRRRNAARLTELIGDDLGVVTPRVPEGRTHVWHQYTVLLPQGMDREAVIAGLAARSVGAGVYYPGLVWDHEPYRDNERVVRGDTPRAADVARRCLSLPVHPGLGDAELERVAAALRDSVTAASLRR